MKNLTKAQMRVMHNFKNGSRYPLQGRGQHQVAAALKAKGLINYEEVHVIDTIFRLKAWLTEEGQAYVKRIG